MQSASKKMTLMQDRTSECDSSNHLQPMEETKELPARIVPLARDDQTVHAAFTHQNQPQFAGCKRNRTENPTQIAKKNLTKQLGKRMSKKEQKYERYILSYDKLTRDRTQNKVPFIESEKAFQIKLQQDEEKLSKIDKKKNLKEHTQMSNQIAASKSRHQKLVEQEQARIVLKNEKQKSADRKLYIETICDVLEDYGIEFYRQITKKVQEKILKKRSMM